MLQRMKRPMAAVLLIACLCLATPGAISAAPFLIDAPTDEMVAAKDYGVWDAMWKFLTSALEKTRAVIIEGG